MKDEAQQVGGYLKFRYEQFLTINKQREEILLLRFSSEYLISKHLETTPTATAGVTVVKYWDRSFWSESCRVLTVFPSSTTSSSSPSV